MDLDGLRNGIADIDREIVRLIAERTDIARKIGDIKISEGASIRDAATESRVIKRYVEEGRKRGLDADAMETVARTVIREAVDAESGLSKACIRKKVAVIGGSGKMGGWTASLMERSGHDVMIIDPASGNGLTVKDCKDCDTVVVSVPIHSVSGILCQLKDICRKDTLIFDLSSMKTPVAGTLKDMATSMKVCSVHPMFGPSASSLYDRNLIVCDCGCRAAAEEAAALFDDRGANIRIMDIDEHDSYMAYVLGLTHAVNIALFTVLQRSGFTFSDLKTVASTTFNKGLDTNRSVASEDPMLYYEIQHTNAHRDRMWSLFSDAVRDLREASMSDDPERFTELMDAGREYFES